MEPPAGSVAQIRAMLKDLDDATFTVVLKAMTHNLAAGIHVESMTPAGRATFFRSLFASYDFDTGERLKK